MLDGEPFVAAGVHPWGDAGNPLTHVLGHAWQVHGFVGSRLDGERLQGLLVPDGVPQLPRGSSGATVFGVGLGVWRVTSVTLVVTAVKGVEVR